MRLIGTQTPTDILNYLSYSFQTKNNPPAMADSVHLRATCPSSKKTEGGSKHGPWAREPQHRNSDHVTEKHVDSPTCALLCLVPGYWRRAHATHHHHEHDGSSVFARFRGTP